MGLTTEELDALPAAHGKIIKALEIKEKNDLWGINDKKMWDLLAGVVEEENKTNEK